MTKVIHNRGTCKLIIKTAAAYEYVNEQLRLCFYVLDRCFVVLDIHHKKNIPKQFFASGSVSIGAYSSRRSRSKYSPSLIFAYRNTGIQFFELFGLEKKYVCVSLFCEIRIQKYVFSLEARLSLAQFRNSSHVFRYKAGLNLTCSY